MEIRQLSPFSSTLWDMAVFTHWISENCPSEIDGINPYTNVQFIRLTNVHSISPAIWSFTGLHGLFMNGTDIFRLSVKIGNLVNLKQLDLSYTNIVRLPVEIGNLRMLQYLYISGLRMTQFPVEILTLTELVHLDIGGNNLSEIPNEISNFKNLKHLDLSENNLSVIPLSMCEITSLQRLYLHHNKLFILPIELGNLIHINRIDISYNNILTIPPELGNFVNIYKFKYLPNPINYLPPNIERMLNQLLQPQGGVYTDAQSVHNSYIQKSISNSIINLLGIFPLHKNVLELILEDTILPQSTKEILIEYSRDKSIHCLLKITFEELLVAVWNRIISFEQSIAVEIKKTLIIEMKDAECKCFTGRISRLVNCLSGFDPAVIIQISDAEQIGTIITMVKDKLDLNNSYTVEDHKRIVEIEMKDRGFSENIITHWITYIE